METTGYQKIARSLAQPRQPGNLRIPNRQSLNAQRQAAENGCQAQRSKPNALRRAFALSAYIPTPAQPPPQKCYTYPQPPQPGKQKCPAPSASPWPS